MENRRHYKRHWGMKAAVSLVAGFLLAGVILLGSVVHTQLQWKNFQLELAMAISEMQRPGGSLKATSSEETASVCADNAYLLLRMVQVAKAASSRDVSKRNPSTDQLVLEFGTGEELTISLSEQDTVHLRLTLADGESRTFRLGKCDFAKMRRITSVEGAAYKNAPWPG